MALAPKPAARTARPIHSHADGPPPVLGPVPVPGRAALAVAAGVVAAGVNGAAAVVGVIAAAGVSLPVAAGVSLPVAAGVVVSLVDGVPVVDGVCACDELALTANPNVTSAAPTATPPTPARIDRLNFTRWPPSHGLKSS